MANITKSIHGRKIGLSKDDELIVASGKILLGDHGSQQLLVEKRVIASPQSVSLDTTITTPSAFILANAASAAITITLPLAADGGMVVVKKTDSTANTVTVDGSSLEEIDGDQTCVIQHQNTAVTLVSDGSSWHMV